MHCESEFGFDFKDDFEKKRTGHSNMKNYRAELTGVFGDPVDDNPTGVVEEAAFAAKNLNYRYLTIKVLPEDLGKAMDSVKIFELYAEGFNYFKYGYASAISVVLLVLCLLVTLLVKKVIKVETYES